MTIDRRDRSLSRTVVCTDFLSIHSILNSTQNLDRVTIDSVVPINILATLILVLLPFSEL